MNEIWMAPEDDGAELLKALTAEGYSLTERRPADPSQPHGPWALIVDPFDERVTDMVDVYGGWLPGDPRR